MKFLVAVLFSLGSLTAFAAGDDSTYNLSYSSAHSFEYYHGSGVLKKPSGKSKNFLASLTIRALGEGQHNLIYGFYFENKSMHYDIVLSEREGATFFDVMSKGDTVGYGYCLRHKCHLEYTLMGYHMEDTIKRHKRGNAMTCTSSKRNEHGIVKTWRISLKKIF